MKYFLQLVGFVALLFVGATLLIAVSVYISPASTPVRSSSAQSHNEVEYKIRFDTGVSSPSMNPCGKFSVTYAVPSGTAQKEVEACKGVTIVDSFRGNRGDFLYLSIQNTWPRNSQARFSCIISVDGSIIAQVESVGTPNIASCSTSMP